MAETGYRPRFATISIHPRHLFLPATLAIVLVLRWKLAMPWWGLAIALSVLPLYYFVIPLMVRRRERVLEREVLRLVQQGKGGEALELYRGQWLLRVFGAPDRLERQLGFIYAQAGDFAGARDCYERAARVAKPGERLAVLLGLARARYRCGDYEGAEVAFREILRRGQDLPDVLSDLAHSLVLRKRDLKEATRLAEKGLKLVGAGSTQAAVLHMTLAEALLARGQAAKAKEHLGRVAATDDGGWLEARRAWVEAQLAIHDGDEARAQELLGRAADLDKDRGLGDLALRRLAELSDPEIDRYA